MAASGSATGSELEGLVEELAAASPVTGGAGSEEVVSEAGSTPPHPAPNTTTTAPSKAADPRALRHRELIVLLDVAGACLAIVAPPFGVIDTTQNEFLTQRARQKLPIHRTAPGRYPRGAGGPAPGAALAQ